LMDFSPVTTLREWPRHTRDEQQDTGFNIEEFAAGAREDRGLVRESCSPIDHRHPQMVVRCIARTEGKVLLCQRADEPRRGLWNTPGGFVESGETLRAAVIRETLEETGISVRAPKLACIHTLPQLNQIVMTFLAEAPDSMIAPGEESLDARLFELDSMPWRQLAFPSDSDALRRTLHYSLYRRHCLQVVECFWDANGRIFTRQL
jgi:ADP-ribose pyrophosphatase YjhB (NUDIX family)